MKRIIKAGAMFNKLFFQKTEQAERQSCAVL